MPVRQAQTEKVSIQVNVIRTEGKAALVEWFMDGGAGKLLIPHRGSIPTSKIKDGLVDEAALEAAVPYGLPWENLKFPPITSTDIAVALRQHGIWTVADYRQNPSQAMAALISVFGKPLKVLAEFANNYRGG